ncbi:MAG: sugar phosphate nucleotidyltransferase [Humidesulfovibrio sp.]|nr:sugar phosphate nucleotidyltransferase [Humidesulfovibrio sp.]
MRDVTAVIQAGGLGTRLRPYTLVLPKPLMPVCGTPVLELTLKWLRRNGITRTVITLGHLSSLIKAVCGDGSQWGIDVHYSEEREPLGTMGPLRLIDSERLSKTFLVLNGDLVTDMDLSAFIKFHMSHDAPVTVAVTKKEVKVDLGVLHIADGVMNGFEEKPTFCFTVSMGIYCFEPEILKLIPTGVPFGFDDLMTTMLELGLPVRVFEHSGMWMDIGRPEDFSRAQDVMAERMDFLLGY